ncbi:uncharacterized protein hmgxb4b isoform 2-T3 [Odontesthes bonariensis]|uniref:uncharacterized protein hmgxb4b isoform X2 n=1 Tax=Odontesthes bonariensis TaxID=219752 RepID=UPI003F588460
MDGEANVMSPRDKERPYKDFRVMKYLEAEERGTKSFQQESNGSLMERIQHIESSGTFPAYPVFVSQDRWTVRGEEENIQDNLLYSFCTVEGSRGQSPSPTMEQWVCLDKQHNMADGQVKTPAPPVSDRPLLSIRIPGAVTAIANSEVTGLFTDTSCPFGSLCGLTSSAWEALGSTSRSPCSSDQDPVSAAAHLHLLGESLSLIGHHLQETNKMVCMSSTFSLLLDSLLCALAPLMGLTTQIPELASCTECTLASTLENLAYVMPGL